MNGLEILGWIFIGVILLATIIAFISFIKEEFGESIKKYFSERSLKRQEKEFKNLLYIFKNYENDLLGFYHNYKSIGGNKDYQEFINFLYHLDFTEIEKMEEINKIKDELLYFYRTKCKMSDNNIYTSDSYTGINNRIKNLEDKLNDL